MEWFMHDIRLPKQQCIMHTSLAESKTEDKKQTAGKKKNYHVSVGCKAKSASLTPTVHVGQADNQPPYSTVRRSASSV